MGRMAGEGSRRAPGWIVGRRGWKEGWEKGFRSALTVELERRHRYKAERETNREKIGEADGGGERRANRARNGVITRASG